MEGHKLKKQGANAGAKDKWRMLSTPCRGGEGPWGPGAARAHYVQEASRVRAGAGVHQARMGGGHRQLRNGLEVNGSWCMCLDQQGPKKQKVGGEEGEKGEKEKQKDVSMEMSLDIKNVKMSIEVSFLLSYSFLLLHCFLVLLFTTKPI